jgi:hypothetical protein
MRQAKSSCVYHPVRPSEGASFQLVDEQFHRLSILEVKHKWHVFQKKPLWRRH